MISFNMQLS